MNPDTEKKLLRGLGALLGLAVIAVVLVACGFLSGCQTGPALPAPIPVELQRVK